MANWKEILGYAASLSGDAVSQNLAKEALGNDDKGTKANASNTPEEESELTSEELMAEMQAMAYENAVKLAETNYELTQRGIEANIERFPRFTQLAREETFTTADEMNAYMQDAFTQSLDELYPEWRTELVGSVTDSQRGINDLTNTFRKSIMPRVLEAADQMSMQAIANVNAQLRGEINDDVAAELKRHAAELSQQIGVRGQAAQFLVGKDIAKTSYELQQQGLQNAAAALGLAPAAFQAVGVTMQMPVQSAANVTNILNAYRAPTTNVQELYGANLGIVSNAGIIPAGTLMQTNAQITTNAMQSSQAMFESALSYEAQMDMNAQASELQDKLLREQKKQNTIAAWQSVFGLNLLGGK